MKSTQVVLLDTEAGKVMDNKYKTGVTKLFGHEFKSRGDRFLAEVLSNTRSATTFGLRGQTGSKLHPFMIDYDFRLTHNRTYATFSLGGTHDGYPSYVVSVNGVVIYDFPQGFIGELAGSGDVEVGR
jgi:hypothetical protein